MAGNTTPMRVAAPQKLNGYLEVLLIGYQDQDNLGLRYLTSSVKASGYKATIINYSSDARRILQHIRHIGPDVVGFSLIFQYMAPEFGRVIQFLRDNGVRAYITIGGHYSSFESEEILRQIPGLDSVVRFEGELTLVHLLDSLAKGTDWRRVPGIAFREESGEVIFAPLRTPVGDLDSLPWPDRTSINYEGHPLPTASILGSRGCPWDCSFCSIRPFYESQGGRLRRLRNPGAVVAEMIALYRERGVQIFLFQDDDFLAGGKRAKKWAVEIADLLVDEGLGRKVAFKISCRSDEIDEVTMKRLIAGGLSHVYMGVESGDEKALLTMNKRMKPDAHFRAGQILKDLGLSFDFGFMLLDPYSTIESVHNNIKFLERFIGDGWSVAPFCRMLPYAGTPIKQRLEQEHRLEGTISEPDYKFLDPKLDLFYNWMIETFYERNFTSSGLCHILRGLIFEAHLGIAELNRVTDEQRAYLHYLTAVCNRLACYALRTAIDYIESEPLSRLQEDHGYLRRLTDNEQEQERRLLADLEQYYNWVHQDSPVVPGPVISQT